ncbi:MAG: hypothetical protein J6V72_14870 [Kiritimatiellae bacterium]|nr:hypothetical protein [Kiritimatiellia bacterium]
MGLFGKKKEQQPKAVQVSRVEAVESIPNAKMVSGCKYFQDEMRAIQGDKVFVKVVDRRETSLKFDDYAVVLCDMTPVGTLSAYGLEKLNVKCGDVVQAIVQRSDGCDTRLWIPIQR